MTNAGTLVLGYGATLVVVGGYAGWLWRRARRLGRSLGIDAAAPTGSDATADGEPDGNGSATGAQTST